jgi:hypothetical protein
MRSIVVPLELTVRLVADAVAVAGLILLHLRFEARQVVDA